MNHREETSDQLAMLLRQREASVRFGRMALQSNDLASILDKACELTATALATDLSKIMRLEDSGRVLRVVAGVGWAEGVVGEETIPAVANSSEGFALKTGRPAISEDFAEEDRFDYADFLKRHGVEAMVNVVIPGPDGKPPYGLLQVDSRIPRDFTTSDVEFLQSYANLVGAAIERHDAQEQLSRALEIQERLLAELQHRIGNSLAVITTLLRMKANRAAHPATKQDLADVLNQVDVLREVYAQLHASANIDEIDLGGYVAALVANLVNYHSFGSERVRAEHQHAAISVGPELAVNLGLVVNEFVTNSLKHAADGDLVVSTVIEEGDGFIRLMLADDGVGIGDAVDKQSSKATGSGIGLMEGLLRQLDCGWEWSGEGGTRLDVRVPITHVRRPSRRR
jgi:two-component sensor histidine kinase